MKYQEQEFYAPRENKQSRYDKRLILKTVRKVKAGLARKEANRIYELGKASLNGWMKRHGSPDYKKNKIEFSNQSFGRQWIMEQENFLNALPPR